MSKKKQKIQHPDLPFGKQAAVIPLPVAPIKKGKSQQPRIPPLPLVGHEILAKTLRERKAKILALTAEQAKDEAKLIGDASLHRYSAEVDGRFHKTVEVAVDGEPGKPVLVEFKDAYSDVDVKHEPLLREILGEQFPTIFRRVVRVKAKDQITAAVLRETLGDKYDAFLSLFKVEQVLAVRDTPLMEIRANLRPSLSPDKNAAVDDVLNAVQSKPTVVVK